MLINRFSDGMLCGKSGTNTLISTPFLVIRCQKYGNISNTAIDCVIYTQYKTHFSALSSSLGSM